jgi:hypothetical protein
LTDEQVASLKSKRTQGVKIVELMEEFKVSKASIYRALSFQWCKKFLIFPVSNLLCVKAFVKVN